MLWDKGNFPRSLQSHEAQAPSQARRADGFANETGRDWRTGRDAGDSPGLCAEVCRA